MHIHIYVCIGMDGKMTQLTYHLSRNVCIIFERKVFLCQSNPKVVKKWQASHNKKEAPKVRTFIPDIYITYIKKVSCMYACNPYSIHMCCHFMSNDTPFLCTALIESLASCLE